MKVWTSRKEKYRRFFLGCLLGILALTVAAVQPTTGYFTGTDLQPINDATIADAEAEPAVVLVFAVDQKTADTTRQFNDWYLSAGRPDINVFAVAVNTANMSPDVALEAINQRDLAFPVFLASADLLYGDDFRLFVLDGGLAVERFSSFDPAVVNAAIGRLGIPVPDETAAAAPEATPEVGAPETAPLGTPVSDPTPAAVETVTTTTTTITESEVEPQSVVEGGQTEDNFYINDGYGLRVEFPPGWKYQVAARRDGAVAIEPRGSQMDMRVWAVPGDAASTAQAYVDQRLETLAQKQSTRVNVDRRFEVHEDGRQGVDVTYNYAKPIDPDSPMRGLLLYRGRIKVYIHDGYVKAASVQAPAGEYTATMPMVESFFRSFEIQSASQMSPVL